MHVTPHAIQQTGADLCPCGGAWVPSLPEARDWEGHEVFQVVRCAACGLGKTVPVPEALGSYYGPAYHGGRHGFTQRICLTRRVGLLARAVGCPGRLLDVGCGDGSYLLAAGRHGWRAAGTELGPMAEILRAKDMDVRDEVGEFPSDPAFEAVTLWHSLEHLSDPASALREIRERLASGGALLVAVPDADGWQARCFGVHWLHLDVPRHLWHFGPRSLARLLDDTGFQVRWQVHRELEYDLAGWIQSLLNRSGAEPNALFKALTGRPHRASRRSLMLQILAAAALSPLALLATWLSAAAGRGGTLVVCATPKPR